MAKKILFCQYCRSRAVVAVLSYRGYIAARPTPKMPLISIPVCKVHEGCANFQSMLTPENLRHHPDLKVTRYDNAAV